MGMTNAERQERWRKKRDAEIAALRKAAAKAAAKAEPETAQAETSPLHNAELKTLRNEVKALRDELQAKDLRLKQAKETIHEVAEKLHRRAAFSRAEAGSIVKVIHPDSGPNATVEQRTAAMQLWNREKVKLEKPAPSKQMIEQAAKKAAAKAAREAKKRN